MAVNILLKRSATASKRPVGASMAFGELNLNYDAATGGLFYKNSNGNVVKVGPCQVSATAPNSSPAGSSGNSAGEFWFDTSTQTLKLYDGTAWVEAGGSVQGVTGTSPITVNNTDPLNPVVGINAASTIAPGAVQLNDTTSSSSTTEALTANQGRSLQEQINALAVSSNLTLAGTLDASTGDLVTVTTEGAAQGFAVGDPLPAAAAGNAEFFVIATTGAASYTPPGGSAVEVHIGDWFLSSGTVWNFLDVGFQAAYASTTTAGIVQLATDAEVQAGSNTDHAVVPSSLQSKLSDSVSTTSSTTIASSTAAKTAYDAGIQGQTDAAAAQATADQAVLDAAAAQGTADQAILDAAAAQSTANQAVLDAAAAQSSANAAQSDATQALSDAAAAQVTADGALQRSGGSMTGNLYISNSELQIEATGTFFSAGAATFSGTTELNGSTSFFFTPTWLENIGPASQVTFDNTASGLTAINVQAAIDEVDGLANAAQATADAAMPLSGGNFTGNVTFDAGTTLTLDPGVTFLVDGTTSVSGGTTFVNGANTVFDTGSTTEVNGSFTFNTAPVFPAGVDIGAAEQVTYDNALSGLAATNVQAAIDELAGEVDGVQGITGTAPITVDNTDPANPIVGINSASTSAAGAVQLNDTVTSTSDTEAATANAVKTAYDAAVAAQGDATQALSDAAAAQGTADAALPKAGGTMTGNITFQDAGEGVVFSDASSITGVSDSVSTTSSIVAASSSAVKVAYDAAIAAAGAGDISGIASATVLFVNSTAGNDSTGERGTTKAYLTITAALADAQNGDTIFLSPGSFTENVTLTKGVNMVGTYNEQGMGEGTSIVGNFVFNVVAPAATANPTLNHIRFVSPNTSNAFKVLNNSFGAGGISTINDCAFVQAGDNSTTEFAFETAGTWTRSMYIRRATFDGNVKHAAGTAAGASGYLVLDDILATGAAIRHYNISTGTVEFRRPSNALSPVLQTGGVILFTDCISGITPSNATTSPVFGGTNISYKGSAASVGTGTVYFNGYAPISGLIQIGANMVYGWSALNVTPANLTISGSAVAYTTAVPAAAATVTASQQRPRLDLLTTTSSVAAANQLATVVDSANGTLYSVSALDAGVF